MTTTDKTYLIHIPINEKKIEGCAKTLHDAKIILEEPGINYETVDSDGGVDWVTLSLKNGDHALNFPAVIQKFSDLDIMHGSTSTFDDTNAYRVRAPAPTVLN